MLVLSAPQAVVAFNIKSGEVPQSCLAMGADSNGSYTGISSAR